MMNDESSPGPRAPVDSRECSSALLTADFDNSIMRVTRKRATSHLVDERAPRGCLLAAGRSGERTDDVELSVLTVAAAG